jgi:tetratricopeptide (TPR) repeat protein
MKHRVRAATMVMAAVAVLGGCAWQAERSAFHRGVALYERDQWDAAVLAYGDALAFAPRNADIYVGRGAALLAAGEYDAAIADFTRALSLDPWNAAAAWNRGLARVRIGDVPGAQLDWRHAIRVESDPAMREWMRSASGRWIQAMPASVGANLLAARGPGQTGRTGVAVIPGLTAAETASVIAGLARRVGAVGDTEVARDASTAPFARGTGGPADAPSALPGAVECPRIPPGCPPQR